MAAAHGSGSLHRPIINDDRGIRASRTSEQREEGLGNERKRKSGRTERKQKEKEREKREKEMRAEEARQ